MRKFVLTLAALCLLPSAALSWTGPAQGTVVHIASLIALADGSFYANVDEDVCTGAVNKRVAYSYVRTPPNSVVATEEGKNQLFSLLLAATASHRAVRVFVDEPPAGSWGCLLGAATLAN